MKVKQTLPYVFVISSKFRDPRKSSISCFETGAPAAIPVLNEEKSMPDSKRFSSDENMAGTPWRAVQRSLVTACRTAIGWKVSLGKTMLLPCVTAAKRPRTSPKQ